MISVCSCATKVRRPSVPDFLGQSRLLTTCPTPRKNHSSPGTLICPVFAHLCRRMLTHRWPKISLDLICIDENITGGHAYALHPAWELSTPPWISPRCTPDISLLRRSWWIAVPKLWSPYTKVQERGTFPVHC